MSRSSIEALFGATKVLPNRDRFTNNNYLKVMSDAIVDEHKLSAVNTGAHFNKLWLDSTSNFAEDGVPIISDPDSLNYVAALGINGTSPVILDTIGSKGGYSPEAGGNQGGLVTEFNDYAYYPYYINRPDAAGARFGSARWKVVDNEYPSGVLEYSYTDGTRTAMAKAFVKEEVSYTVFDLSDINDMRFATSLHSIDGQKDFTGGFETSAAGDYIAVKDNTSGLWFAAVCTNMTQYQVDTDNINATVGLDTAKKTVTNSACVIGIGCGSIPNSAGKIVFCTSIGLDKATVVANVLAGLTNWRDKLEMSLKDWYSFYHGLSDSLTHLSVEQRAKYYMCLHQIRSLSYKGYLSPGTTNWTKNFIRDTAWVVYSLCDVKHEPVRVLAESFLSWFNGIDSFVHANSFTIDKKRCETSMNQTDSAPTFLLATAKLCRTSNYDARLVQSVLEQCMVYALEQFVEADGHIAAYHAHDYWDDYVSEIDVGLVKYESMIDVLWILALEQIEPVFDTLGNKQLALFCSSTARKLRDNLEDYRMPDGGLYYAIKKDGALYSSVVTLPGTLYAAWLLNDEKCTRWVMNYGESLRIRGGLSHYPLTHSNTVNAQLASCLWMPYMPVVALIAHSHGDDSVLNDLAASFPFGGLVEYATISKTNSIKYFSHAHSFAWAEAMYIGMAQAISIE